MRAHCSCCRKASAVPVNRIATSQQRRLDRTWLVVRTAAAVAVAVARRREARPSRAPQAAAAAAAWLGPRARHASARVWSRPGPSACLDGAWRAPRERVGRRERERDTLVSTQREIVHCLSRSSLARVCVCLLALPTTKTLGLSRPAPSLLLQCQCHGVICHSLLSPHSAVPSSASACSTAPWCVCA